MIIMKQYRYQTTNKKERKKELISLINVNSFEELEMDQRGPS